VRHMHSYLRSVGLAFGMVVAFTTGGPGARAEQPPRILRAGAAAVDITPTKLPVIVCGSFRERTANRVHDRLMSRALVLDDGRMRLAIVIVDILMMPRERIDDIKRRASSVTGIPVDRMLIAATHTHSAASAMACLGSRADEAYCQFLPSRVAKSIELAAENLVPARIGWGVISAPQYNHCRRWIFRPDRMATDPFGQRTVRAHMHPGYQSPNHIGPAGPADTDLSLLAVQTRDGRPLAVLANFAFHYYGSPAVSADVCGRFGDALAAKIGIKSSQPAFVGMLSQGTSGDSMWMDYSQPAPKRDIAAYTNGLAELADEAYGSISYHDWVPLAMAETTLTLRRRVPDKERLSWARQIVQKVGDRLPQTLPEIYAFEQIYLHEKPKVELKLQAVRIGDLGITAIPNEVYGITGLKLKAQSPLQPTFNIELANGAQGYIPPPEQHVLGGYTTWPARTAGLEVQAEPRIVEALLKLLEQVADRPRRPLVDPPSAYSRAVLASKPLAYWRLGEMEGQRARDAAGRHDGQYEPGVVFYLPGPDGPGLSTGPRGNRAVQFAGGRVKATMKDLGPTYSVEFWFWNGLPVDARAVTGYLFSIGRDGDRQAAGDHWGIGGTERAELTGKLIFFNGNRLKQVLAGRTSIPLRTWNHVVLVRDGKKVTIYLNGQTQPDLSGEVEVTRPAGQVSVFLGGRCDGLFGLEGRLDEVALYDRALAPAEVAAHFKTARAHVISK